MNWVISEQPAVSYGVLSRVLQGLPAVFAPRTDRRVRRRSRLAPPFRSAEAVNSLYSSLATAWLLKSGSDSLVDFETDCLRLDLDTFLPFFSACSPARTSSW